MGMRHAYCVLIVIMRALLREARSDGVTCLHYIDDFIVTGEDDAAIDMNVDILAYYIEHGGFIINWPKSFARRGGHSCVMWTGVACDSASGRFYGQPCKIDLLQTLVDDALDRTVKELKLRPSTMLEIAKTTTRLLDHEDVTFED